tara:strand:- start:73 stop:222 length:150 start_codon:yes stop_codon:yes gene_type:complete
MMALDRVFSACAGMVLSVFQLLALTAERAERVRDDERFIREDWVFVEVF